MLSLMEIDPLKIPAFMRRNQLGKSTIKPVALVASPRAAYSPSMIPTPPVRVVAPVVRRKQKVITFAAPFMEEFIAKPEPTLIPVGTVTHFFDKIKVAVLQLSAPIKIGDRLQLIGEKGPFKQTLKSMQIDRQDVFSANLGDDIGIKVTKKVVVGEMVYSIQK
ncbi:MAG: hypothetical protein V1908_01695 [Candidatus Peregrinibacteria bacterium]